MSRQGAALSLVLMILPAAALATETLLDSQSPYWEAGPRDQQLSRACSLGRFNERQMGRYVVRLHARTGGGAAVLGEALSSSRAATFMALTGPGRVGIQSMYQDRATG